MRLFLLFSWLLSGIFLFSCTTFAQTLRPEYQTFTKDEPSDFFNPRQVDGEYDSDFYTFVPSSGTRAVILDQDQNHFFASVGSLSSNHFFIQQEIFAHFSLTKDWHFQVVNFRNQDFEDTTAATILEFQYQNPDSRHGISLYGDADFTKSEDDIGVAYLYRAQRGGDLRFYYTAPDFSRNERNLDTDRFENHPSILGFQYQKFSGGASTFDRDFTAVNFSRQNEILWRRPDEERVYTLENWFFSLEGRRLSKYFYLQWDQKSEGEQPDDGTSAVVPLDWRRDRLQLHVTKEQSLWQGGIWYRGRHWQRHSEELRMQNWQPHLARKILRFSGDHHAWWAEYSMTSTDYDGSISSVNTPDARVDHRLNLKAVWRPSSGTEMIFLFTLDGDRLSKSDRWEGGNIQLTSTF